jgi:hypothetical protein
MLEHWSQGLQIGLSNLMVSFFQPWGQYKGHNFQHLLVLGADYFSLDS